MQSHWRVFACDLDGTLIGRDHKVNERDLDALRRARTAGIHVAICTGRNAVESAGVIGALELSGLGVFVNGAMVSDMASGAAVYSQFVSYELALETIDLFGALGHAVLILADDRETRMPVYLLTEHGIPHRGTREWLIKNRMNTTVIDDIPMPYRDRIVRLGIVVDVPDAPAAERQMDARLAGRASTHSIYSPYYDCQVIEVFSLGTSKWTGIVHLCEQLDIRANQAIAIGDDINDRAMLENAALSFAMGNAAPAIQRMAKRITAPQELCGVAQVIDDLLAGRLEPNS